MFSFFTRRLATATPQSADAIVAGLPKRLEKEGGAPLATLGRAYLANLSAGTIAALGEDALLAAIRRLYEIGRARTPAAPAIATRAGRSDANEDDIDRFAILEVVQDDRPFLIDSTSAIVRGMDTHPGIQLSVHPILLAKRDAAGKLLELAEFVAGQPVPSGMQAESWLQMFFDSCPADTLTEIERRVARAMDDVRRAVTDFPAMRTALQDARNKLAKGDVDHGNSVANPASIAEAQAFLNWLDNDHFTYLGCRDYAITGKDGDTLDYVQTSGRGILSGDISALVPGLNSMLPEVSHFSAATQLVLVTKTESISTVHRPVPMDAIFVKLFDDTGRIVGERLFIGLFTGLAYSRNARDIPLLRQKAASIVARTGYGPNSHNGKALTHILDTYPRDELFQIGEDDLYKIATGIMQLEERPRVAIFVRRDPFGRSVSCLVYIPREDYDTNIRTRVTRHLEAAFGGKLDQFNLLLDTKPLARLYLTIKLSADKQDRKPQELPDMAALEAQLAMLCRSWRERLQDALIAVYGEDKGLSLWAVYRDAFSAPYRDSVAPELAVIDISIIQQLLTGQDDIAVQLAPYDKQVSFKLFRRDQELNLSDTLPMLQNLGLHVQSEYGPYQIDLPDGKTVWLHDYRAAGTPERKEVIATRANLIEESFLATWRGSSESDRFNALALEAGLDWRTGNVLRALGKYMRQLGLPFAAGNIADTLSKHPAAAQLMVDLFTAKFDPDRFGQGTIDLRNTREETIAALDTQLADYIRNVPTLDEDRILSTCRNLLQAAVRTNYYQLDAAGQPKPYLSIKFLSGKIDAMPLPKPMAEIWVYSPRVEAIHLRGGKVARGGIRWSDRREDFRTEILGLMKAQQVKNAVIVPVGSKGGFFVKQPDKYTDARTGAVACYSELMRGILDITDNYAGANVVPPARTVRHDDNDPYLVVAADKGTATFSDIANAISIEYGFWLGDAFASGGSAGYDHKEMGITARGAWESVKRHFRELGVDTQQQSFTCIGVGDMAGDVFGNGLLRSPHTRLIAAFNYAHIFVDPTPDAAASFTERQRLFALGRGSWDLYNSDLISAGGGVWPRTQKSIPISAQMKETFGISADALAPDELMKALLCAPTDLLYFGGIGTYIKSTSESQLDVGDKANDAIRISAPDIRARVIGEGANLGITQLGRIQLATRSVKLNTDAIDNSAGVDTSDHEVNIKILAAAIAEKHDLPTDKRDTLLKTMTDEVADLVLRDNYLQTQALSLAEAKAADLLPLHRALMQRLESIGLLNRAIEYLPDDAELARRESAKLGLTRPELSVLLAYSKLWLFDQLVKTPLMTQPALRTDLDAYFPKALATTYKDIIPQHRLAHEITATVITNEIVNRLGSHAVAAMMQQQLVSAETIARAYLIARDAFQMPALWAEIEALDNVVPARSQTMMGLAAGRALEQAMTALLVRPDALGDIAAERLLQTDAREALTTWLASDSAPKDGESDLLTMIGGGGDSRLPAALQTQLRLLGWLPLLPRLSFIARESGHKLAQILPVFAAIDDRLQLRRLTRQLQAIAAETPWQSEALTLLMGDMLQVEQKLASAMVNDIVNGNVQDFESWLKAQKNDGGHSLARYDELVKTARAQPVPDFALWSLISRELLTLVD